MKYKKYLGFPLVVIVVASLWFISKYKDDFKEEILFNISFKNVPEDIIISEESLQLKTLVEISASGFTLIKEKTFGHQIVLDFSKNVFSRNDSLFFNPEKSLKNMKRSKTFSYSILNVDNFDVHLKVKRFQSKKVALINKIKINYNSNFVATESPSFNIDSILVTGNDQLVATIKELVVTHDPISVSDTLTEVHIDLKTLYPDLKFDQTEVTLAIGAAQMTEGKLISNVQLLNAPVNLDVKLIPEKVEIVYSTAVTTFDRIEESDIRVYIDYNNVKDLNTALIPTVEVLNKNIASYRIAPNQIQVLTIK